MDQNTLIHNLLKLFQCKNQYQLNSSNIQPQDMYIPPSTLIGIIDRLESKKLIERLRTNIDRRAIELLEELLYIINKNALFSCNNE